HPVEVDAGRDYQQQGADDGADQLVEHPRRADQAAALDQRARGRVDRRQPEHHQHGGQHHQQARLPAEHPLPSQPRPYIASSARTRGRNTPPRYSSLTNRPTEAQAGDKSTTSPAVATCRARETTLVKSEPSRATFTLPWSSLAMRPAASP